MTLRDDGDSALDAYLDGLAERDALLEEGREESPSVPDEVLFGDPRGEGFDREYEDTTVNVEDVQLLDRYGGTVL